MTYQGNHKLAYELKCLDLLQAKCHSAGWKRLNEGQQHIRHLYSTEYSATNTRGHYEK